MFIYIKGCTYLYRLNAFLKFLLICCVEIAVFITPLYISFAFICLALIVVLTSRIPIRFVFKDLKGAIIYSVFIIVVDVLSFLIQNNTFKGYSVTFSSYALIIRLSIVVLYTSLFFRSTSSLEIIDSLENVEHFITRGKTSYIISKSVSLFISFIPLLFSLWNTVELSYRIRKFKNTPFKIVHIFPFFIMHSIEKANAKLLSLKNREEN